MCVHQKSFMGQTIDLCTLCAGEEGGDCPQRFTIDSTSPTSPTKWSVSKNLDAVGIQTIFKRKVSQKKKKFKTPHWKPISLMSKYFTSCQTVDLCTTKELDSKD